MKACGDKWRGVREAETANGVTWPQYLARCRAQAAGGATDPAPGRQAASTPAASKPAATAPETSTQAAEPARAPRSSATAAAQGPVFPQDIAARHASERPALGRQRTCADQFKANKTTDANGGLRWIEQGGGYWSRCNAHLKQTRA